MALQIRNGQTLLFIGDSITDCGRRDECPPFGRGYVKLFADLVAVREPRKRITLLNRGINGDRVNSGLVHIPNSGLTNRWEADVLKLRPDWLGIMIGVNDVTSNIPPNVNPVPPDVYRRAYDELLARTRAALPRCRLLLMEPFLMLADPPQNEGAAQAARLLPDYLRTVQALSRKYRTRLLRTHRLFTRLIRQHGSPQVFGGEAVHPNATGHLAIAEAVYAALSA
jgi:lysophospholipase L1-like esterase